MSPRLKSLLLILIFTFLAGGLTLAVLSQIQAYRDSQVYLATEAALPVHRVSGNAAKKPVITPSAEGRQSYKSEKYGFEFQYDPTVYAMDNLAKFKSTTGGEEMVVSLYNIKDFLESERCQCGEIERFQVSAVPNPQNTSLGEYLKKNFQNEDYGNLRAVSVDGVSAVQFGYMTNSIIFQKDKYIFRITSVESITRTFKFIK